MSLHALANHVAEKGRGPDSMLIHMSPREVRGLQALAQMHGGSLTVNPETGLPEAGWLDKLLPAVIGFAINTFAPGVGTAIGETLMGAGAAGAGAVGTGLLVGGAQAIRTGNLGEGISAGLGAYGGANIAGSLASTGGNILATTEAAKLAGDEAVRNGLAQGLSGAEIEAAKAAAIDQAASTAPSVASEASPWDKIAKGFEAASDNPQSALRANAKNLMYAAGPAILAGAAVQNQMPQTVTRTGTIRPYYYDPYGGTYTAHDPYQYTAPTKAADGGLMGFDESSNAPITKRNMNNTGGLGGMFNYAQDNGAVQRMAGGGLAHFAQGGDVNPNDISAIEAALAAAQGKSDAERNAVRDQLLTTYDPNTLYQAPSLSQFGGYDQYATAAEEARQRMAGNTGGGIAGTPPVPDYNAAPNAAPSATPQITAEQRSFIDWQQAQPNPYGPGTLADVYKSQGITDPYNDPRVIAQANAQLERAQNRQDLYASSGVAAPTDEISPWQDPNWKNYLGTNKEAYTIGMQAKSDPAAYKALKAQNGWDDATAQSWILKSTDPKAWAAQAAAYDAKYGLVAGPGNGPSTPSAAPTTSGSQPSDALRAQATQQLLKDTGAYAVVGAPSPGSDGLAYTGQPPSQDIVNQAWAKYYATLGGSNTPSTSNAPATGSNAPSAAQQYKDQHLVDPTTGHLLNPTLTAAQLQQARDGINTNAEMQQAYNGYWSTVKPGDILDFAGGTLTMNPDGSSTHTYTDASGRQQSYTFTKDTDFATVAKSDPNIAAEWKSMFNYSPYGTSTVGSGGGGTTTVGPNIPNQPAGGNTGMTSVSNSYTQGGGSLGYTPYVPTSYADFNAKYNTQTGGSKQAYDYLTGKADYSPVPYTKTGEVMKPYAESVLGIPQDISTKRYLFQGGKYVKNPAFRPPKPVGTPAEGKDWVWDDVNSKWTQGTPSSSSSSSTASGDLTNPAKKPTTSLPAGQDWQWNESTGKWEAVQIAAHGGLMALAGGGMADRYNLGGYSDGGRLLRGPGDGVSDSIPATIGHKQPARLADGEFVVPARIVSELGNGSTEAGARKLYAMMDRVQSARRHSIGKGNVAKNSRADKYLPA